MVADRPQLRRNHILRSHSCMYADAATWAYPLPSSCATRPDAPGRFLHMAVQKPVQDLLYCQPQPCPAKKADTPESIGLYQIS